MHGLESSLIEARELAAWLEAHAPPARVALCPPASLISRLAHAVAGSAVEVGAQDCRAEPSGPFTGDLSAEMLADAGARLVILGHSERRAGHGESDADVAAKVVAALRAGLEPIVCVGESLDQHRAGRTRAVVTGQVRGSLPPALAGRPFALAYEPVWAIGSGLTPSLAEIESTHGALRGVLREVLGDTGHAVPILYGGSVKPANAAAILKVAEVGGALVGGASLTAREFCAILAAA
jgi:triosephosphate isomerase